VTPAFRSLIIGGAVGLVALVVFAQWRGNTWSKADQFRRSLHCDLTPGEVAELADQYGASFSISEHIGGGDRAAIRKGGTVFYLQFQSAPGNSWMDSGRLRSAQRGRLFGLTGLELGPKQWVCSGASHLGSSATHP
jgi:hypothetical protein